jgi:hypothetical protein
MSLRSAIISWTVLSLAAALVATPAFARAPGDPGTRLTQQDLKSGFGRPESIQGTISLVKPEEGLLIVTRHGPSEPTSTEITVATPEAAPNDNGSTVSQVTATNGTGETDYNFRVIASTLIKVGGQTARLGDLAGLENRQVTVHFIPKRSGNYAFGIDVAP